VQVHRAELSRRWRERLQAMGYRLIPQASGLFDPGD
jgi:hypothetical protein